MKFGDGSPGSMLSPALAHKGLAGMKLEDIELATSETKSAGTVGIWNTATPGFQPGRRTSFDIDLDALEEKPWRM